jgi:hypothetical protein
VVEPSAIPRRGGKRAAGSHLCERETGAYRSQCSYETPIAPLHLGFVA